MRLFFGQIKNIHLLQREHVCQLLFRSMCVNNGIITIYLRTRYCIRTMQFHIMLCLFQINVSMLRPKWYSWSMFNLNTGKPCRVNRNNNEADGSESHLADMVFMYITNVIVPISQPKVNVINGILCCILKTRMRIHEHIIT